MNNFETYSPEERKIIQSRAEVDQLDEHEEGSVHELALKHNQFRDELEEAGTDLSKLDDLMNKYGEAEFRRMKKSYEVEKLNREKNLDPLTGIGDRRAMNETIPRELSREKRNGNECSLLMLDIDLFKKINDKHGHLAGDKVIQSIVRIIQETIRSTDYIFRYAGDELTVFLPASQQENACKLAELIRLAVKEESEKHATVSIGCVDTSNSEEWKKDPKKIDMKKVYNDLLEMADKALYVSKGNRDAVSVYEEEASKAA